MQYKHKVILELGWLPKSIWLTIYRFLFCHHQQIQNYTLIFYIDYFDHKIVALDIVKIWHHATRNLIGYTSNKKTWSKWLNNNPILYTLKSPPFFWFFKGYKMGSFFSRLDQVFSNLIWILSAHIFASEPASPVFGHLTFLMGKV